jgi:peptide/nickel transport system substrate-binding protein
VNVRRRRAGGLGTRPALIAALVALGLALSGCGGEAVPGVSAARTFTDLIPALPSDLDEAGTPDPNAVQVLPSWSSELVRPAASAPGPKATLPDPNDVVPYLATSWQRERNGDYVFQLRHGVRGATGDLFTAADVSWSFARALAVSPDAPFLLGLANVDLRDPVTVLGTYAVRINVTAPSPFLLAVLSWYDEGIYDSKLYRAHTSAGDPWGELWGSTHSATYGAYHVVNFVPGKEVVLAKNPGTWEHPYYEAVVIKQAPSSAKRVAAVLDGHADHTTQLDWDDYYTAIQSGPHDGVSATIAQSGPEVQLWALNEQRGPFANVLVRRALNVAVNRLELIQTLNDGFGTPATDAIPAIDGQRQGVAVNLSLARHLLRRAGYRHGLSVTVLAPATLPVGEYALLSQQLAQVGITLNPSIDYDADQLIALEQHGQVPSSIDDIAPLIGGAGFQLLQDYDAPLDPASPAAESGYRDPRLFALLAAIRDSPDGPGYQRLLARAEAIIAADVPVVDLFEEVTQNVTNARVGGYSAYAVPTIYYENLHPIG